MITRLPADRFQSTVHKPNDFDQFWDALLEEVTNIPLEESIEPVPLRSSDEVETFEIHYDSLDGVRIGGWYCRPQEEWIAPPYPGLLIFPGYISEPTLPKSWAKMGYAAVGVAPRGKLRSNSQYNPGYPGLLIDNIIDRQTYSYRGFYIDAVRAVDFLLTRPEVDPARIGVHGSSQGGALTLSTAALRSDVITCGAAGAPYLTGFMDAASLTHTYPYEEMNEYLRLYPERKSAMRETVAYFDCVNFGSRITCPMLVYAGLGDDVCPPETAFALKQEMAGPLEFHTWPRCAHDAGNYWEQARVEEFLARYLQPALGGQA